MKFLTTFFLIGSFLLRDPGAETDLLSLEGLKEVFFSIENVFFPSREIDEISIFLETPVEIVKVFFFVILIRH
jgi:hypothetical protein